MLEPANSKYSKVFCFFFSTKKSAFFFEKKKQKTFIYKGLRGV